MCSRNSLLIATGSAGNKPVRWLPAQRRPGGAQSATLPVPTPFYFGKIKRSPPGAACWRRGRHCPMRLLRENVWAQKRTRDPPTHSCTRSFVHSSTARLQGPPSHAPFTCPALSGHQDAAPSMAGSHRLGVDLLCRSQARRTASSRDSGGRW